MARSSRRARAPTGAPPSRWEILKRVPPQPIVNAGAIGGTDTVIKVAIAGVGNCASALVQGVEFYKNVEKDEDIPGVMHARFGDTTYGT